MAIYHLSSQVIGRSAGRSAVACAAYRSAQRLVDRRTGLAHDYTRRRDEIEAFIEAPEGAPEWARERSQLWNMVEAAEKRKDSQLAREIDVALPVELGREEQDRLIREYVREQFVGRGMVADVAIHRGDYRNPHAHVMLTMREISEDSKNGFGKKVREWNGREMLQEWRQGWERSANRELERAGYEERVDHRSFAARGLDREPTVHEGPDVREMEARGLRTERGERNREARRRNAGRELQLEPEHRSRERQSIVEREELAVSEGQSGEAERRMAERHRQSERRAMEEYEKAVELQYRRGREPYKEIEDAEREESRQQEPQQERRESEREERRRRIMEAREREREERERGEDFER